VQLDRRQVLANSASPIVKWAGGKSKLLPELIARLPATWNRYYEPFVGGAALFFKIAPERAVLGDVNADLIAMYRGVADELPAVTRLLRVHQRRYSADHFYRTRTLWNTRRASWTLAARASSFIFLNRACFNGLWRVNRAGEFNVPFGRYTNPPICMPEVLGAAHTALQHAELRAGDYRATLRDAKRGDFVYLDSPYAPVSATSSFTSYASGGFGENDQRELAATARALVARGCHVLLTNSDTPLVRSLYAGFQLDRVKCPRSINSDASARGNVDELIIYWKRSQ
jgi:DNA adenine methylase